MNEELIGKELELDERLEAKIDKTIKSLCQIKAMKEMVIRNQNSSVTKNALKSVASPAIQDMNDGSE